MVSSWKESFIRYYTSYTRKEKKLDVTITGNTPVRCCVHNISCNNKIRLEEETKLLLRYYNINANSDRIRIRFSLSSRLRTNLRPKPIPVHGNATLQIKMNSRIRLFSLISSP